jgi:hypothetical protein
MRITSPIVTTAEATFGDRVTYHIILRVDSMAI